MKCMLRVAGPVQAGNLVQSETQESMCHIIRTLSYVGKNRMET